MADDPSTPTCFGWDGSHYDGILHVGNMLDAKAEGIVFFTHKIGEGRSYDDPLDATNLAAAYEAGIEFIGGYYVVRTGDVTAQVDNCIALADRDEPWWRTFPGWFWQVDLERWPYDSVAASVGIEFGKQLRARTGRQVILYASRGQYGDQLTGWDGPLWNAAYGTNPEGPFRDIYPGDTSTRWAPYSGQVPAILQYGSRAIIAGLTTCDANAFRGTLDQLRALITGDAEMPLSDEEHRWLYNIERITTAWAQDRPATDVAFRAGDDQPDMPSPYVKIYGRLDAIEAKLDAVQQTISDEQLERVLRKVIGSVDGSTPA